MKLVDFEEPTPLLDQVHSVHMQRECQVSQNVLKS